MKTILKTAAVAAILTGFANSAQAIEFTPLTQAGGAVQMITTHHLSPASFGGAYAPMASRNIETAPEKAERPYIAVARLHEGRFLPLPNQEAPGWALLNNTGQAIFSPLSAAVHFELLPEIAQNGVDSDNKIDEIRLAAAAAKQDYVLIYAVNGGASWGRFGDRDLDATGLIYDEASDAVRDGDAKAILVQTHTGEVIGAVTTFAPDMKTLTELVGEMTSHVLDI